MQVNTIYNEDCLKTMRRMPDGFVNLVLTDPPYVLENHGGGQNEFSSRQLPKDLHIDYMSHGYDIPKVFEEFERICQPLNLLIFCSNGQISETMGYWQRLKYSTTLLVWHKPNAIPFHNGKYQSDLEFVVFVRGKNVHFSGGSSKLFSCSSPRSRLYPTQKPLDLVARLLNTHSRPEQVVYDPFIGSGTVAVACKNLGRNYIGSEISKEYCEIAEKRLRQEVLL